MSDSENQTHTLIPSQLDNFIFLFAGLNKKVPKQTVVIQTAATGTLTRTKSSEPVGPVLSSLHWASCKA